MKITIIETFWNPKTNKPSFKKIKIEEKEFNRLVDEYKKRAKGEKNT